MQSFFLKIIKRNKDNPKMVITGDPRRKAVHQLERLANHDWVKGLHKNFLKDETDITSDVCEHTVRFIHPEVLG